MSSYATVDRNLGNYLASKLGPVDAQAVVTTEGGTVGDVSLGRYSTILNPAPIPTSAPVSHTPFAYSVQPGESLNDIAARYGVSVAEIRWSNTDLMTSDAVTTGQKLVIPPVPGIVVTTKASDTVAALATQYSVDPQAIIDFNRIRDPKLVAGMTLIIPGGTGGAFPPPPALWQLLQRSGGATSFLAHVVGCCLGPYVSRFPVGWCTYYVATKRNVTWNGDAGYWYANAAAQGYKVGPTPTVGSIMVTWESWAGHVAYVESVNADGSWTVSEMNWLAFDVIDVRTIKPGQLGGKLVGFIY